ncbi:MAG TPA: glycosyltransferase family 2 protein [Dehalococcoidia bacterium]|nr:glycosyltransferase family 2 protein [Dehalococcoidia bacterium]
MEKSPVVNYNRVIQPGCDKAIPMKVIVGTPAYNEEKYIGTVILQARQHADEVIVVDDGSTDRTRTVAELAGATVIRHESNRGYGNAVRTILAEARTLDADVLIILDADSQHNPDEIPSLVEAVSEGYDVVIGSREKQKHMIPRYRRMGQKVLSGLTNLLSGEKIADTESGFRAYSRKAINELELKESGMAVSSEIIKSAAAKKLRIKEVPISVSYTGDGSSLNPVSHGAGVLRSLFIMISEERPLLFFGILGIGLIIAGIVMGILVVQAMYTNEVLQVGNALVCMLLITVGVLVVSTGIILRVLTRRINDRL